MQLIKSISAMINYTSPSLCSLSLYFCFVFESNRMPSDHFAWPETRSETAAKPAAVNRFFFSFFLDFFLWMDKQSESRRVRELDRVRQCDNCQWDKTNWFIMNDSSRANKLHADTGKMHLGKRKTERKRSEAREREMWKDVLSLWGQRAKLRRWR